MKTVFYLLFLILLSGCLRPHHLIEKGQYDQALSVSLKKLKKGRVHYDDLLAMEKSFRIITEKDRQTINQLKSEGRSDVWPAIYKIASTIIERQERLVPIIFTRLFLQEVVEL